MFSVHHKSGKIIEYCAHTAHSICGNCIIITVNCNHLFILVSSFKILIDHNLLIEVGRGWFVCKSLNYTIRTLEECSVFNQ